MQEARKIIYLADTGHEAHVCISSEPHQTREVCFWIPKCRAQEARVSEVSPPRRNIQQREVRVSSHRHEARVFTTVGLIKSAFLKCRQINATINNVGSASLYSGGTRPAFQS